MNETPIFELVVDRDELAETIEMLCRFKDTTKKIVELYIEEGQLAFSFGIGLSLIDCDGEFSAKVRIQRNHLKKVLGLHRTEQKRVLLLFYRDTLRFSRYSVPCKVGARVKQLVKPTEANLVASPDDESNSDTKVPGNANAEFNLLSLLKIAEGSGELDPVMMPVIDAAKSQADSLINNAALILKPLEVTSAELKQLIDSKLK